MTCSPTGHHFSGRPTCDCGFAELVQEPGYAYVRQVDEPYPGYRGVLAKRVRDKVAEQISQKYLSRN